MFASRSIQLLLLLGILLAVANGRSVPVTKCSASTKCPTNQCCVVPTGKTVGTCGAQGGTDNAQCFKAELSPVPGK